LSGHCGARMALPLGPPAAPVALLIAAPAVAVMVAVEHIDSDARIIIVAVPAERLVRSAVAVIGRAVAVVAIIAAVAIAAAISIIAVSAAAERERARGEDRDV